jgi:hypothetical protein
VSWDNDIAAAAQGLMTVLGSAAVYVGAGGSISTTAIIRRDLQQEPEGFQGPAHTRRVVLDLLTADVGDVANLRRGEEIHVEGAIYRIEQVLADDGVVVSVACYPHEVSS